MIVFFHLERYAYVIRHQISGSTNINKTDPSFWYCDIEAATISREVGEREKEHVRFIGVFPRPPTCGSVFGFWFVATTRVGGTVLEEELESGVFIAVYQARASASRSLICKLNMQS